MCMQYPYTKYGRNVPFKVSKKTYNYTGISYDIDKLDQVVDVDRNSPDAAGIRPRDIIERSAAIRWIIRQRSSHPLQTLYHEHDAIS